MANVNHSSLTDPYIHEPKGVASASVGKVYVANGSGSGTWTASTSLIQDTFSGSFVSVSTGQTVHIPVPFAGTVVKVVTVLEGTISSANAIITVKNAAAASMGTITVTQSGSAAGAVDSLVPSSNNSIADNSFLTITTDGGSSSATILRFTIVLDRT